jgi:hypothetical protein
MFKRIAIAFSVANLCFFKTWSETLSPQTFAYLYFRKDYPGFATVLCLAINVLLLTAIFYAIFSLLWRSERPILQNLARFSFLVIFLRALNVVRVQFPSLSTYELRLLFGRTGFFVIGMALLLLLILVIVRYGLPRVTRVAAVIALIISPFGLLAVTQATWLAVKYGHGWQERTPAPLLKANDAQPRVLWLIFDEMGERLVFTDRPASLNLPNLDRLRAEGLLATNAFPPAGHTTQSIPALLTGRLIASVKPAGPNELLLTFPEQPAAVGWSTQPDIFTEARAAGFNTAAVGWYHPYCRVVGDRLTSCLWEPVGLTDGLRKLSIRERLLRQEVDVLPMLPFTGGLRSRFLLRTAGELRVPLRDVHQKLVTVAGSVLTRQDFGLAYIHLPVPHPPYIYDRKSGLFDTTGQREYLDNLALADRTVGELREAMERAGTWDGTTIVISSDHWWRTDYWRAVKNGAWWAPTDAVNAGDHIDHRIPFLIRMAGQKSASTYEAPFNTVLTHDLILEILRRRLTSADQIPAWLDLHKTIGESPYQAYEDPE